MNSTLSPHHPQPSIESWYCVQTQSKREHIAANWLRLELDLETYVPRIRYRRVEARGPVWVVEALFPNYLFARFQPSKRLHQVRCLPGIVDVVHFGAHYPAVPDDVIDTLRLWVGAEHIHVIEEQLTPGQLVQIVNGPFQGLEAIVTRVLPARQRVNVLLEMIGRQTCVELHTSILATTDDVRGRITASDVKTHNGT